MNHQAVIILTLHSLTACSAKVIYESDLMQDFLCLSNAGKASGAVPPPPASRGVKLSIKLPDSNTITVTTDETARTPQVLQVSHPHTLHTHPHSLTTSESPSHIMHSLQVSQPHTLNIHTHSLQANHPHTH